MTADGQRILPDSATDFEPTQEDIEEYAKWLGMDLAEDRELLWIAIEGLKAPLPQGWKACETAEGEMYYFNFDTGESSWDHPLDTFFKDKYKEEKVRSTPSIPSLYPAPTTKKLFLLPNSPTSLSPPFESI